MIDIKNIIGKHYQHKPTGKIDSIYLSSETAKIIMDNYQELHLPEQQKDGDILINNDRTDYKVFLGI